MMEKGCGLARWRAGRARPRRNEALALRLLTGELSGAANGFRLLAGALLGRLFVIVAEFHLAEDAFALHLFLQRPERLIHIVIANDDLHAHYSPFQRLRKLEWPKPFPGRNQRSRIWNCSNKRAAHCPDRAESRLHLQHTSSYPALCRAFTACMVGT